MTMRNPPLDNREEQDQVPTVRYNQLAYQLKVERQLQDENPITQRDPTSNGRPDAR